MGSEPDVTPKIHIRANWMNYDTCSCIERILVILRFRVSPRVQFYITSLHDYIIKTVSVREVVSSIPAKNETSRNQIYLDLNYIDPQARVLNYCFM